ncbi:MAG: hypothetical protein IJ838_03735 [Paludibacteraceae bacterium]|nr:hypothetical protein [Paludibacteraceae bacterium]
MRKTIGYAILSNKWYEQIDYKKFYANLQAEIKAIVNKHVLNIRYKSFKKNKPIITCKNNMMRDHVKALNKFYK